ncbi:MAG: AAA family ATPase [Chlorobiaceae bacterium]|nr:AAA family ATPase [Chlorobiaceae bacterium]
MRIILQRLTLKHFKGVEDFTLDAKGQSITVYGRNGSGKTTLADALTWLLTGKDTQGQADFSIKTIDQKGEGLHMLEHSVEAEFSFEQEGIWRSLTLKKVFAEKYTKRKGSRGDEFTGHETTHFVNSVPKSQKEYLLAVNSICPDEVFRLITSITYFNSLHWQKRRALLLDVCGDVSDADVIASKETLSNLTELLDGLSLSDYMKKLKSERPKINEQLNQIPHRIDEVRRTKPKEEACLPPQGLGYSTLQDKIRSLQHQRAARLAGDTSEISQKIVEIRQAINQVNEQHSKTLQTANKAKAELESKVRRLENERTASNIILDRERSSFETVENELERLRTEYREIRDEECPTVTVKCPNPSCGEVFTVKLDEEQFNSSKAARIKKNQETGIAKAAERSQINQRISKVVAEIEALEVEIEKAKQEVVSVKIPDAPDHTERLSQITELEKQIGSGGTHDTSAIDAEIEEVSRMIRLHDEATNNRKKAVDADQRTEELKAEQKRLGQEIDLIDSRLWLCEEFIRTKVSLLTERVNEKFSPLQFKLFNVQINGGLDETCETLVPSPEGALVPWSDVNTGHKILAGLKIVQVLSSHFGKWAPLFIDNAESLTMEIPDTEFQLIKLMANDLDNSLTVEAA